MRGFFVRFGFAAIGMIYVAMGIVSARVAFLGARDRGAGVPGALRFLLEQPHGALILGAVVVGLAAIAAVRLVEAWSGRRGAFLRLGLALSAVGYAALAWTAARVFFHNRQGGSLERTSISWLLTETWGATALGAVALLVVAGGVWETYQGFRGRLSFQRKLLPRHVAWLLSVVARFGLVARGLVLGALGYFLFRAALELDPNRVRSFGGALRAFSQTALGPVFMGIVAAGLIAYGVYMWTLMLLKRKV